MIKKESIDDTSVKESFEDVAKRKIANHISQKMFLLLTEVASSHDVLIARALKIDVDNLIKSEVQKSLESFIKED